MARPSISKTPLGRRLTEIRENLGFSKRKDFAAVLGINPETLGGYERGETTPEIDFFNLYKQRYSVNLNWLISGTGDMFSEKNEYSSVPVCHTGSDKQVDPVHLPIYNVSASAGYGIAVPIHEEQRGTLSVAPALLHQFGAKPSQCKIIEAHGDSMMPTIPDGAQLIVDFSQREIVNGWIIVINVGGDLLVKRINKQIDGTIDLTSDNKLYEAIHLNAQDIEAANIIGRVVYFGRQT